ncbi:hypothetical protein HOLleu_40781 [Holothuria leucospilota]|uniref:Uncharacterized protein n=1 Tax=Holothuria leucospilota TaxID=206669 RepID=A0A9Q0YIQ7_HOLLE|nr:hypothetical protein HOLleu_40781 [Holothuria leucospilota]
MQSKQQPISETVVLIIMSNRPPYFMLTGRQPDLSKMEIFGTECYAYKHDPKKIDSRCEKGIFVGYDKNIPANLVVYHASKGKVLKYRFAEIH